VFVLCVGSSAWLTAALSGVRHGWKCLVDYHMSEGCLFGGGAAAAYRLGLCFSKVLG
jgi:hypothetical protein